MKGQIYGLNVIQKPAHLIKVLFLRKTHHIMSDGHSIILFEEKLIYLKSVNEVLLNKFAGFILRQYGRRLYRSAEFLILKIE